MDFIAFVFTVTQASVAAQEVLVTLTVAVEVLRVVAPQAHPVLVLTPVIPRKVSHAGHWQLAQWTDPHIHEV